MTEFNDDALIAEFVTESREHLATIEPDLLALEQDSTQPDAELINRIFRAIHSIKGASGFFGFEGLKRLSHVMENLLMQLRDGQASLTPQIMESLLKSVDKLNILFGDIYNSDTVSVEDEIANLSDFLSTGTKNASDIVEPETSSLPVLLSTEAEMGRLMGGTTVYLLDLDIREDLQEAGRTAEDFLTFLQTIGEVHSVDESEDHQRLRIRFSSVLEQDLLEHATSLPGSRIQRPESRNIGLPSNKKAITEPGLASPRPVSSGPSASPAMSSQNTARAVSHDPGDSIRVRVDLLNRLMELAGEMVLSRNQLLRTLSQESSQKLTGLDTIAQNIDLITTDLQEHIMQTRMQPIGSVFSKFPRIIRDMGKQLGKELHLVIEGEDVELDKSIIESLSDPLTHLIRNCCDHGIELSQERLEQGKAATGNIFLRAFHQDGQINISISDDGRGINTDKLVRKALEKSLITEDELKAMSTQELANLIFLPGLSTAEKISDISGRGVGMDVVKTNITRLGGQIQIESSLGEGTTLLLRLPLTLAIIPSLIVGVAGQRFAIPQVNLVELVHIRAEDISNRIEKVGTAMVLKLRGQLLPLLRLSQVLQIREEIPTLEECAVKCRTELNNVQEGLEKRNHRKALVSDYKIIVLRAGNNQFGLMVDTFYDMEEIVVKSLSGFLKNCRCFSGATIMGDGLVAMILDPSGIIAHSGLSFDSIEPKCSKSEGSRNPREKSRENQTLLLFANHPSEFFAVSLSEVLRVEKIDSASLSKVGHQEFIQYESRGLPLLRLENCLPIDHMPTDYREAYLIIPKQGGGRIGIIVSRVIDVMTFDSLWKPSIESVSGITGWAVIQDRLTVKLDFGALLKQAGIELEHLQGEAA